MNRRTLLGRLAAGAAAVLGCGMVAPKAEAAEIDSAPIIGPDMQVTGYVSRAHDGHIGCPVGIRADTGIPDVNHMTITYCDGAVKVVPYGEPPSADHTALVQGYIDRGEVIPEGEYNISQSLRARGGIVGSGPGTVLKWTSAEDPSAYVVVSEGSGFVASGVTIDTSGRASGVRVGALTFEAMKADCGARGCRVDMQYVVRSDEFRIEHQADPSRLGSIVMYVDEEPGWLARSDAWRRSLHEASI